jgi:hypothetical protein
VAELGLQAQILKIELLDSTFRYDLPRFDQTLTPIGECGIEVVLRKRPLDEIRDRGWRPKAVEVPREIRIYLNQYRDDVRTLKQANVGAPPFMNDGPV